MNKFYSFISATCSSLVKFLFRVKVEGLENEPAEGGVLVCSNHISFWDVAIIGAVLNRQVRFFAKKEVFHTPILRHFAKAMGAFPVDRKSPASAALAVRYTVNLVTEGEMVGIFPQGTRCSKVDPRETDIKNGVGQIVYRSGVTVLPVCIQTKKWKASLFRRTYVRIGKPISADQLIVGEGNQAEYSRVAHTVFDSITSMIEDPVSKKDGN